MSLYRGNRKSDRKNIKISVNYLTQEGDSTPDMEKLLALSDLFGISLDELVTGNSPVVCENVSEKSEVLNVLEEKMFTPENKKKAKKGLKIAGIIAGIIFALDFLTMIIYFLVYGIPK